MKAEEIMMPLFGTNQQISLADYVTLTPKEYKTLTGKKLSLKEKISLKLSQRQLKKVINKDGTVNAQKLQKYYDDEQCSRPAWFLIGFFLGAIGLLIAAFTNRDKRRDRVKWALIGWGTHFCRYISYLPDYCVKQWRRCLLK